MGCLLNHTACPANRAPVIFAVYTTQPACICCRPTMPLLGQRSTEFVVVNSPPSWHSSLYGTIADKHAMEGAMGATRLRNPFKILSLSVKRPAAAQTSWIYREARIKKPAH